MTGEQGSKQEPPETVPAPPALDLSFDAFERVEPIGEEGTADVFRARVPAHELDIAVKQPRATLTVDRSVAEGLVREAETWAKLDGHDGVVSVLGWGAGDAPGAARPWIAMEHMDAGDLRSRLGTVGLRQGLWIAREVTAAVWHAHRQGRTHHDLKPANVLFRECDDGWDAPKVTDWELSQTLIEHSTDVEGQTLRYAAPEQLRPERFDGTGERTDIYQLGTLIYELLTGEHPFAADDGGMGLTDAVLEDTPRPPTAVAQSLPPHVDDVVLPALARAPEDRYEASLDLRRALTEALEAVAAGDDATPAVGATGPVEVAQQAPADEPDAGEETTDSSSVAATPPTDPAEQYDSVEAYRSAVADELAAILDRISHDGFTEFAASLPTDDGLAVPPSVIRVAYPELYETAMGATERNYDPDAGEEPPADSSSATATPRAAPAEQYDSAESYRSAVADELAAILDRISHDGFAEFAASLPTDDGLAVPSAAVQVAYPELYETAMGAAERNYDPDGGAGDG
jgi:serine/threonine protein kinase